MKSIDALPTRAVAFLAGPVCGCDGETYVSDCQANMNGVDFRSRGACEKADCRTTGCDEGDYCSFCWGDWACIPEGAVC